MSPANLNIYVPHLPPYTYTHILWPLSVSRLSFCSDISIVLNFLDLSPLLLNMKKFIFHKAHLISLLALVFLSVSTVGIQVDELSATPKPMWDRIEATPKVKQELKHGRPELFPMGSGLPDCSHACGPCFPCKRVIVGVKCLVSESCPVVYRCMCKGKYYHVPSN